MADVEINDLTNKAVPESTDEVEIQETAGGSSYKATMDNLSKAINLDNVSSGVTNVVFTATDKTNLDNQSGTNTGDNAANTTYANDYRAANFVAGTDYEPAKGADDNFVTDAEKVVIGNTSGTNTGDQVAGDFAHDSLASVPANDHIDWTIDQGATNIHSGNYTDNDTTDHTALSNIGTNTHAQLDTHVANTSNPHSVSASQVGNTTAQWNANQLYGSDIDSTVGSPSDGKILVWRSAGTDWVLEDKPAPGSTPAMNDISDVTISTVADNEVLAYDNGTSEWINQTPAEAGLTTPSSTDTFTNKTFDANGTGNSISNIDVADLANGTDGELITWSAAAAPTTVATGNDGEVLKSNGAGAAPAFEGMYAGTTPPNLLLNSLFRSADYGTSAITLGTSQTFFANRWWGKKTVAGSTATIQARKNGYYKGGAELVFTNTVADYFYFRQTIPNIDAFSGQTYTLRVDVGSTTSGLEYDIYINARWNGTDRVNQVDTTSATLAAGVITHTFTVEDLSGYSYTHDDTEGLEVAFRVYAPSAKTGATVVVNSISLVPGPTAGGIPYADMNYERAILSRFYEVSSGWHAPVGGLTSSSGQKRAFFPFTAHKLLGEVYTLTVKDAVGNSGKVSTYNLAGTRTDNVSYTTLDKQSHGFIVIINSSTASGIACSWIADSEP